MKGIVTVDELATFFGVIPRRVQQLVRDEGMPSAGRGRYDLLACAAWYIRWLRKAVEKRTSETGESTSPWRTQRLRIAAAEAELKEIEVARKRGEIVTVDEAARLWTDAMERIRARMISSVSTAAPKVVGVTSIKQANGVLEAIVYQALAEVAVIGEEVDDGGGDARANGSRAVR